MTTVMKFTDSKRKVRVVELLRAGKVAFDTRPGWMLVSPDVGAVGRARTDLFWVHTSEVKVDWVRDFSF